MGGSGRETYNKQGLAKPAGLQQCPDSRLPFIIGLQGVIVVISGTKRGYYSASSILGGHCVSGTQGEGLHYMNWMKPTVCVEIGPTLNLDFMQIETQEQSNVLSQINVLTNEE